MGIDPEQGRRVALLKRHPDAWTPALDGTYGERLIRSVDERGGNVSRSDEFGSDADRERIVREAQERILALAEKPGAQESTIQPPRNRAPRDTGPGAEARNAALRAVEAHDELSAEAADPVDEFVRRDKVVGTDSRYLAAIADPANPIRSLARVVTIATSEWKGVSSAGVTASWDPEATEVSDDSPTLAQPVARAEKGAVFVPFSIEIGQDWTWLQQELGRLFADAKDGLEATAFISGGGTASNQPEGLHRARRPAARSSPTAISQPATPGLTGSG